MASLRTPAICSGRNTSALASLRLRCAFPEDASKPDGDLNFPRSGAKVTIVLVPADGFCESLCSTANAGFHGRNCDARIKRPKASSRERAVTVFLRKY